MTGNICSGMTKWGGVLFWKADSAINTLKMM